MNTLVKPLTRAELRRAQRLMRAIREPLAWAPPQVARKVYLRVLQRITRECRG